MAAGLGAFAGNLSQKAGLGAKIGQTVDKF
jgi:hypothetical protein